MIMSLTRTGETKSTMVYKKPIAVKKFDTLAKFQQMSDGRLCQVEMGKHCLEQTSHNLYHAITAAYHARPIAFELDMT